MTNHAPPNYACPFCRLGIQPGDPRAGVLASDLVARTEHAAAFLGMRQWPRNLGNTLVVPLAHYENLYAMPDDLLGHVQALARRVALALKAVYACDGVTLRQHNEPAGSQDVWHYHVHVTPRYTGDNFYQTLTATGFTMPVEERAQHAARLKESMIDNPGEPLTA